MGVSYYSKPRPPFYQKWEFEESPPPFHWKGGGAIRFRPTYRIWPPKNEAARDGGWGIYIGTLLGDPAADEVARKRENDTKFVGCVDDYQEGKLYEGVATWEFVSKAGNNGMTYAEWQLKLEQGVMLAEALSKPEITELLLEVPGMTPNRIAKLFKWVATFATELDLLAVMDETGSICLIEAGIRITPEKREALWKEYVMLRRQRDTYKLLGDCQVTAQPRKDAMAAFSTKFRETMQEAPEKLLNIDGIGFVKAHKVWMACGIPKDDLRIVAAGMKYTLDEVSNEGHCWSELAPVLAGAAGHLSLPQLPGLWYRDHYEDKPAIQRLIHIDEIGKVWSRHIYEAECAFALRLSQLAAGRPLLTNDQMVEAILYVDSLITSGEEPLDDTQRASVLGVLAHLVSVLTGSAGTGKTTIIRTVIKVLRHLGITDIVLCAFTGKAAENATAKTGYDGVTCHSAVQYIPGQRPKYNADSPMYTHSVIIDEVSMLDLSLANMVAQATPVGSMFLLVGDEFQLPPIGPGAILRDIIASGVVPAYRLENTYRQDPKSHLLELFKAVRKQKAMQLIDRYGAMLYHDIEVHKMSDPQEIKAFVLDRYGDVAQKYHQKASDQLKIITYRKGTKTADPTDNSEEPRKIWDDGGVMALNRWIVEEYHYPEDRQVQFKAMGAVYTKGHRGLWLKNTDKTEYPMTNGKEFDIIDMWHEDDEGTDYVFAMIETLIDGKRTPFRVKLKEFDKDFMHGYALTIHKSQGSEYPEVIFVIRPGDRRRLTVAAAYTALSRARTKIIVIGDIEALWNAVDDHDYRQTGLTERLIDLMGKQQSIAA